MQPKRFLITGVSRGLGLALAREWIREGHLVAGCARSSNPPADWAEPHHYSSVDLSSDLAVQEWAEAVLSEFGTPDFLINNAAIINRNANLWDISDEEFSTLIDINVSGTARVIRHFLSAMIEQNSGVVVNFSSGWGRSTAPEVASYCASKWAIEGMTQALAQELPNGLAAIALNPGIIDTEMLQSTFGSHASQFPSPESWAKSAAPFIASINAKDNGRPLTCP